MMMTIHSSETKVRRGYMRPALRLMAGGYAALILIRKECHPDVIRVVRLGY
jgi:hypothetical protein